MITPLAKKENTAPLLVVDDDLYLLAAIKQTLTLNGYLVDTFNEPGKALAAISEKTYSAVIADIKMPHMNGIELFQHIQEIDTELPVILITGHGDVAMAVSTIKKGAYDFLQKPVDEDVLIASIERAVEKRQLGMENRKLHDRLKNQRKGYYFHGLVGGHPIMQELYEIIEAVAEENDPVMLYGETGTGKELVARAIHDAGNRYGRPFIPINMGAMPVDMIESELFGHAKGAFTGAIQQKQGKFEYAEDGTIFLDEICSMPINLQSKLLRVLEERSVTPLGSNIAIPIRARIIAATNKDLGQEIRRGVFRQDLYFRLNVLPVKTPALRERKDDIPLLVEHFRLEYCHDRLLNVEPFSAEIIEQIKRNNWPGNIRELKNQVRRICIFGAQDKMKSSPEKENNIVQKSLSHPIPLKSFLEQIEKEYLIEVLRKEKGLIPPTHRQLGISRKSLYDKVNKYGIDLKTFRMEN
ncbi:MAG: sigma-54 dependent transcriptional regulator [Proteobacteria bacterium]|jgi:two-component system C4-dicarboxylate transport response regulator DctD|nr:sigma-54 dependent transcriptional regulator [Pseudomonadota bacterium]MCG2745263.1 sigma-54 dependent transcriptional regulator [Desulfobacteraceae bacterium]MBU4028234.1 sigma-54 dependent transcriptional regulator [Pseudomonadota bacterium]MBU4042079.1 sigma-54 dependent transcriptional regulator [Pseudomonadota bacterium]MBU4084351.1 sigma-54 dependent transcriptional regulator [Pseudomonadota bacterium]